MITLSYHARRAAKGFAVFLILGASTLHAEEAKPTPCKDDAMIVFDASGSMAGNVNQGIATIIPRIDEVRSALSKVLPSATRFRRVGLITFGPGPYNQCNVQLNFAPAPHADGLIMSAAKALTPAGKTPPLHVPIAARLQSMLCVPIAFAPWLFPLPGAGLLLINVARQTPILNQYC